SLSDAGLWLRQSDQAGNQIIIHAEKLAPGDLTLDSVTLFFFNDQTRFISRIDAQTAKLTTHDWLIENGVRWVPNEPSEPFTELRLPTTLTSRKIEESLASPDAMSFWDLPGFITLLEQSGFPAQRHRLHFNVLLARPFLLCAMVLVAATFSLRMQRRGGATLMIIGGVASGFLLYFLSDVVFAFGLSAKVPVTLAAWTPPGVSLIFGVSMLLHFDDGLLRIARALRGGYVVRSSEPSGRRFLSAQQFLRRLNSAWEAVRSRNRTPRWSFAPTRSNTTNSSP